MSTTPTNHEPFDFFAPEVKTDPYPLYERLRSHAPVYFHSQLSCFVVTRYSEVLEGLRHPNLSADRLGPHFDRLQAAGADLSLLKDNIAQWALFIDPPKHTPIRTLISKAFAPRLIESMQPKIQSIVDELLEQVRGKDTLDVVRDLAYPLPMKVIGDMIGIPADERHHLPRWSDSIATFFNLTSTAEDAQRCQQSFVEMGSYIQSVIAERRRAPKDDLISNLLAAEEEQIKLTDEQIIATCMLLLFGGQETTKDLIALAVLMLLRNPKVLRSLQTDPTRVPAFIEEVFRYDSPVQFLARAVTKDIELGGTPISAGQWVFLCLGAANRDPSQFPDPDEFRMDRPGRHVGFGHGIHYCVGAALARLETRLVLETLLQRMPAISLAAAPVWQGNLSFRALDALLVSPTGSPTF